MKKTRFTEQQIAFALRQAEQGFAVEEVNRIFDYGGHFAQIERKSIVLK